MGKSARQLWLARSTSTCFALFVAFLLALLPAAAQEAEKADVARETVELQLEVKIKGYPLDLIAAFVQLPDGQMASQRSELEELGINVPGEGPPEEVINLNTIPGLSYAFDDSSQSIDLQLPNSSRIARKISSGKGDLPKLSPTGTGLVVNYNASMAAGYDIPKSSAAFDGASLTIDARAFSRFGTLRQSAITTSREFSNAEVIRLDTAFSYSDQNRILQYNVGDVISGNLRWTRPVRLGGGQVRRNFALRPDIITVPLPEFQGSAEVPSTIDIFVGQSKAYSGSVEPGPFQIDDLPVLSGSGKATMVLTDANGNKVESETEFYSSPYLLARGLTDFSVEAGVVRRGFGTESFGYADEPVGFASLRYGLTNNLTAEIHTEGKSDLVNGGIGAEFSLNKLGVFSLAGAGSIHGGDAGYFLFTGWEGSFGNFTASASTARAFGNYLDLAAATEIRTPGQPLASQIGRAVDQITLGYDLAEIDSDVAVSFIHTDPMKGADSYLIGAGFNHTFESDITIFMNGYADLGKEGGYGGFLGVSIPLGENISTKSSGSMSRTGWSVGAEATRAPDPDAGGYGWRVGHTEASDGNRLARAQGLYDSRYGNAKAEIAGDQDEVAGAASFEGAAVLAGGGLMFAQPISDAFAIVDTGTPDVGVKYENRVVGKTGSNGKLLLTKLRSYSRNKVSIDVDELPPDVTAKETEFVVVPSDGAGVVVDFNLESDARNATVILTDAAGNHLKEGSEVLLDGSSEQFFVGYDGLVYLTDVGEKNRIKVKLPSNDCTVVFEIKPDTDLLQDLGPFQCT